PDATIWRDSGARVRARASTCSGHLGIALRVFHHTAILRIFGGFPHLAVHERRPRGVLTALPAHIEYLLRAALKRRHVSFSQDRPLPRSRPCTHLLPVFARVDLGFERGEGCWLTATNGDRYLDFTSGVAVNALGHCHPHLIAALQEQATKLWHMSNLFKSPDGEKLAARLCEQSFADMVFFCNSGAEAMEGVIKVVRRYQFSKGHPERYRLITFEGAFHGRTLGTLAAR